jgi:streptomycin 3"-adenylyltransferase
MSQYGWDNCPAVVKTPVQRFTRDVAHLLSDNIIGIYLHGSLALGCFNPARSDLDLLVITHQRTTVDVKRDLAELLLVTSNAPYPIEISFLPYTDLIPWRYPTPFDFHYSETWREQTRQALQNGRWRQWNEQIAQDPDLAAHVTMTRQRGVCLHGAPIAQLFPDIPKEDYLASILNDVEDAFNRVMDNPVYSILNVCRVYAFILDGLVYSKQEGGEWALGIVPDEIRPVIALALKEYANDQQTDPFDPVAITAFVSYMRRHLPI